MSCFRNCRFVYTFLSYFTIFNISLCPTYHHQAILLNSTGSPWSVRWFYVSRPLRRAESIDETHAADALVKALAQVEAHKHAEEAAKQSTVARCPSSCSTSCVLAATALVALSFVAGRYSTK